QRTAPCIPASESRPKTSGRTPYGASARRASLLLGHPANWHWRTATRRHHQYRSRRRQRHHSLALRREQRESGRHASRRATLSSPSGELSPKHRDFGTKSVHLATELVGLMGLTGEPALDRPPSIRGHRVVLAIPVVGVPGLSLRTPTLPVLLGGHSKQVVHPLVTVCNRDVVEML